MSALNISNNTDINWETLDALENVAKYILIGLALFTVATNGVVLAAMYKDPLKCFRTPLTFLVTGIVLADFLVGLVVGPVNIAEYFVFVEDTEDPQAYQDLIRVSQILTTVIINVSFLIIVVLSACQLLAIKSPRMFKRFVTKNFTVGWVAIVWFYAIFFALLPEISGISIWVFWMVDLYAHNVLFIVVLLVLYVLMYLAFKKRTGGEWRSQETQSSATSTEQDAEQSRQHEKQFTKGIFILAALLAVTVMPMTITLGVLFHRQARTTDQFIEEFIAYGISIMFLYLKFALDPLVYVFYFPKYREAVKATLKMCCGNRVELPSVRVTSGDRHSWGTVSDDGHRDADTGEVPDVQVARAEQRENGDYHAQVV